MNDSKRAWPIRAAIERRRRLRAVLALASALAAAAPAWAGDAVQCLVEPALRISLRSPVSAQIAAVHVDRGMAVKKGQLLVSLESSVERAALALAKYRSTVEGQLKSAESRLANNQRRFKRRDELQQLRFVSTQDRDDAEAEMRVAEADLIDARDNREINRLEAMRIEAEIGRRQILSPIHGVVVERVQHPGELAQAGEGGVAILKLAQVDPARIELILPASRFGRLKAGDSVSVRTEAPFNKSFKAVVRVVDPIIDSASGTFGVRLEAPNPRQELPLGVRCAAEL